jgi:hypothetical protein
MLLSVSDELIACLRGAPRWFVTEFLWVVPELRASSIVASACRVLGVVVIGLVLRVSLSEGLAPGLPAATLQCAGVGLLALALGTLAKELAIDLCARAFGWWGRDFTRKGRTLDGKSYRETLYPNGTWSRCVSGPAGIVCEWTDESGACNQIVTRPRKR